MRRVDSLSTLRRRRHVEGVGRLTDFQRRKSPYLELGADTHHKKIHIKENVSWKWLREFGQYIIPTHIQCPLDITTLYIAAALPIATSTPVTDFRH